MNSVVETGRVEVLKWFSGNHNVKATAALLKLEECEKAGEWRPGVSRSVRAALSKSNVAIKAIEGHDGQIGSLVAATARYGLSQSWSLAHNVQFGMFEQAAAANFDFAAFEAGLEERRSYFGPDFDSVKEALAAAKNWVQDMTPVAQLIWKLDAARQAPVFTHLGVSPTITKTLEQLNFHFSAPQSIRLCPMRFERVEQIDEKGNKFTVPVCILEWPAGTVFGASAHAETIGYEWPEGKCHSCGHAIKNDLNWVPLLVDDSNGVPHALWVGTDCSRSLFGIKVKGEIRISKPEKAR